MKRGNESWRAKRRKGELNSTTRSPWLDLSSRSLQLGNHDLNSRSFLDRLVESRLRKSRPTHQFEDSSPVEPFVLSLAAISRQAVLTLGGINQGVYMVTPGAVEVLLPQQERCRSFLQATFERSRVYMYGPKGVDLFNAGDMSFQTVKHDNIVSADISTDAGSIIYTGYNDGSKLVIQRLDHRSPHALKLFEVVDDDGPRKLFLRIVDEHCQKVLLGSSSGQMQVLDLRKSQTILKTFSIVGESELPRWDKTTKMIVPGFSRHQGSITSLIAMADKERIVSASSEGVCKVWCCTSGTSIVSFRDVVDPNVDPLVLPFTASETIYAWCAQTMRLVELSIATGTVRTTLPKATNAQVTALGYIGESALDGLVSGDALGRITMWAPGEGDEDVVRF